jgi:hypothetical protein
MFLLNTHMTEEFKLAYFLMDAENSYQITHSYTLYIKLFSILFLLLFENFQIS